MSCVHRETSCTCKDIYVYVCIMLQYAGSFALGVSLALCWFSGLLLGKILSQGECDPREVTLFCQSLLVARKSFWGHCQLAELLH